MALNVSLVNLMGFLLLYTLGFLIYFLLRFIIATFSFWIGRTYWFVNLLAIAAFLLGGGVIPLDWYLQFLRNIVELLPFQAIYYLPASFYIFGNIKVKTVIMELLWLIILSFTSFFCGKRY